MPKSALGKWARAWWHTRGEAGRLSWECIYKCCLQSKFHSILTSGLVPGALFGTPTPTPCTRRPLSLWGPVSLSLCNPCPDAIYGGTAFPAFVSSLRWAPGSFSKAFPGPFNTARAGGWQGRQEGAPAGPTYCSPGPPPDVSHPCPAGQPWPHNGATSKFSFLAVSFQGALPPNSGSPSTPLVGVGILDVRFSIAGLFQATMWLFFP